MFSFFSKKVVEPKIPPNVCPYCGVLIEKVPTRKSKCLDCGRDIFIRSSQNLFPTTLLTEADSKAVALFRPLKDFGVSESDFQKKRDELSKHFGSKASGRDVIWGLYNNEITKSIGDLHRQQMLYYQMALFLNEEGRNPSQLIEQSNQVYLQSYKLSGIVKKVGIIAGEKSCPECQENAKKIYSLEDAIKNNPIPCQKCTHVMEPGKYSFCRCCYSASF